MKPDEKDPHKKKTPAAANDKKGAEASKQHTDEEQEHTTDGEGHTSTNHEPTLRSATTDSSRSPKNPHDDLPTGGNIR